MQALNTFYRYNHGEANVLETGAQALAAVHDGVFPWRAGCAAPVNGERAAQRHFAQLWRTATAQRDRTVEEESMLQVEVVRLLGWLERRLADVADRIARLHAAAVAFDAAEAAVGSLPETAEAEEEEEAEAEAEAEEEAAAAAAAARKIQLARAAQRSLIAGKLAILELEKARVESMQADALVKLRPYLP
jgi:hypothetical protein